MKLRVDAADQHHRPFGEPRILASSAVVLDQLQPLRRKLLRAS